MSDVLTTSGTLATYIGTTTLSGWFVLDPFNTTQGFLITDSTNKSFQLYMANDLVQLGLNTGSQIVTRAITSHLYSVVTFGYDGVNLQIGVNEVPGSFGGTSTLATGALITPLTGTVTVGNDLALSNGLQGDILEIGLSNTVLTDQVFSDVISKVNSRYDLGLGLPDTYTFQVLSNVIPTTGTATLNYLCHPFVEVCGFCKANTVLVRISEGDNFEIL